MPSPLSPRAHRTLSSRPQAEANLKRPFVSLFVFLGLALSACASAPPPLSGGRVVKTQGGKTFVREWGSPAGPPILMIHGTTSNLEDFDYALGSQLGPHYRLIAYDRPGMGRSTDRPAHAETLKVQAETAADVIRAS